MQIKKFTMLLAAGCALGMLTGCGVPQEEHDLAIATLKSENADAVDKLNTTIAEKDEIIKNEKAKVRSNRIELDDFSERVTGLQEKNKGLEAAVAAEKTNAANLESDLKTQKSMTSSATERATEAENSYSTLDVEYQELKRRFENFRKNMNALDNPAPVATEAAAAPMSSEPQSHSETASSLLDEMGTL